MPKSTSLSVQGCVLLRTMFSSEMSRCAKRTLGPCTNATAEMSCRASVRTADSSSMRAASCTRSGTGKAAEASDTAAKTENTGDAAEAEVEVAGGLSPRARA